MDRRKRNKQKIRKGLTSFKVEEGYLLISTLLFLVFSGLFSHSVIKISGHQIIQLRQFSRAYEAKGAINIGEELLNTYIEKEDIPPKKGQVRTSVGAIDIKKKSEVIYQLSLTLDNGEVFSKEVKIQPKIIDEEELTEKIDNKVEEKNVEEHKD